MTDGKDERPKRLQDTTERMGFALESAKRTLAMLLNDQASGRAVDESTLAQLEDAIRHFEIYSSDRKARQVTQALEDNKAGSNTIGDPAPTDNTLVP